MEEVFEFLYNSDCCESAPITVSIHKTRKGAEMAMMHHQEDIKKDHNDLWLGEESAYDWDFDQWWGIKTTKLKE